MSRMDKYALTDLVLLDEFSELMNGGLHDTSKLNGHERFNARKESASLFEWIRPTLRQKLRPMLTKFNKGLGTIWDPSIIRRLVRM